MGMEVLSDILTTLRAHGSVYFCDRRTAPWTMEFNQPEGASFHLLRRGHCWLITDTLLEQLGPGDLLFVEAGLSHSLSSEHPDTPGLNTGPEALLMCGYCHFDMQISHPLMQSLSGVTIIRGEELLDMPALRNILDLLSSEFTSSQPGNQVIVNRLTEILLVELIRINFGRTGRNDFIAALADKKLSLALKLLHENPQQAWTLEKLASAAAMSRASLANKFRQLVGQTMFEYLSGLRMQHARDMLRNTDLAIPEIANRVGYESDPAFTKAFKRLSGITPTAFRKGPKIPHPE